ncbi:hypothetical protein WN55_10659 [Dufourea novaeangliae]|uniref:Uncharacterized protein n=1 Tax=Dufourea novaeangliae TaxID=178035 RepID=A0A154PB90_DUFNO|nr:hypothetical protein WN55_10659 [Dufourea novaeangliae]
MFHSRVPLCRTRRDCGGGDAWRASCTKEQRIREAADEGITGSDRNGEGQDGALDILLTIHGHTLCVHFLRLQSSLPPKNRPLSIFLPG